MAILKTSATRFAQWLEQYTEEMYLCVPLSRRRLWGFPPVRAPKEINETVVLGITAPPALVFDMASASLRIIQMATLMGEVETGPPDAAIWFKIIPLAAERVQVTIGCGARGAMGYFNELLAAIAKRWPEAVEQLGIEAPRSTGDGVVKKHGPMALIIIVEACIVFALGVLGNKVAELVEIKPTALIVGTCALLVFSIVLTLLRAKPVVSDLGDKRCNSVPMRSIPRTMISLFPVGMLLGMVVVGVLSLFFAPSAQDFLYDYMLIGLIGIILGALFAISIVVIVDRRRKAGKIGKVIVLKGTQQLPYPHSAQYQEVKVEVFYPKPFKHTPTLTIRFPKRRVWGRPVYGESTRPEYRIIDQRPDGFVFQVLSLAVYEPLIEWVASGQPKD